MTIAIIGGGAAGMMAAATILEQEAGARVLLIEKNPALGRKVLISGGGRCNVTTGITNVRELLQRYPRGKPFLTSALHHFSPHAVVEWFEAHGVSLKTEPDMRVFPQSNDGKDIVGVFERLFAADTHIEVLCSEAAVSIQHTDELFHIQLKSGRIATTEKLILTTGGQAFRHTGSTGDGYAFAESLGHTITPLAASLNSFTLQESWAKKLAGISFQQVKLSAPSCPGAYTEGPIVWTHKGISGPAVFALSSHVAFERYSPKTPLECRIDFLPTVTHAALRNELDALLIKNPKQLLRTTLHHWLPKAMTPIVVRDCGIEIDTPNASVSKQQREQLMQWLKSCRVHCIGRGAGDEFVTAGGVDTSEVNPKTMESRICHGLFFAGEILNIDGFTGGFNLQASWATGRAAGIHST